MDPGAQTQPLPKIGRYRILEELGRGMMGVVYRAQDPMLGRTVALKTVSPHFSDSLPPAERAVFEQRFLAEARAAAALQHPGIVVVHDVGHDPDSKLFYIALEHLKGRTLADVAAEGPMPWPDALRIGLQIARALDHAHRQGVVHRDIKPANIMIADAGDAKIMDFGIAKVPDSNLTAAGQVFGTPLYMSPEQAGGEDGLDGRSDLFSLGAVLYLLLTGKQAFGAEGMPAILTKILRHEPPPPSAVRRGIPPSVDAIVARALAKKVDRRYQDGQRMAEDIELALAGRAVGGSSRRSLVAAGLVAAAAVAGALWTVAGRAGAPQDPVASGGPSPQASGPTPAALATPPPTPSATPSPTPAPARLIIDFEHTLERGTLRVWIDDMVALDEDLSGAVTKNVLGIKFRKGGVQAILDVRPGRRKVRMRVSWDNEERSGTVEGRFRSNETYQIEANLGRVRKNLSMNLR
jgi:serine/threonine-protein kinase